MLVSSQAIMLTVRLNLVFGHVQNIIFDINFEIWQVNMFVLYARILEKTVF